MSVFERGRNFEELLYKALVDYFKPKGWNVISAFKIQGGLIPDFVIEKEDLKHVIEAKSGLRINYYLVLTQILSFIIAGELTSGYLAIPSKLQIPTQVFNLYKKTGIGIIKFNEITSKLNIVIAPQGQTIKGHKDSYDDVKFEKDLEKRKQFRKDIIFFVIIAGLFSSSLWVIIEHLSNITLLNLPQFIYMILILVGTIIAYIIYDNLKFDNKSIKKRK